LLKFPYESLWIRTKLTCQNLKFRSWFHICHLFNFVHIFSFGTYVNAYPSKIKMINIWSTTNCQLWFPLIQLVVSLGSYYINIIFPLFCNFYLNILLLISHCISNHNIILPYTPIRSQNSLKVKFSFWNEMKNSVYILLHIQLMCTYGFAFICLNFLYCKCLIGSLSKVNSFKPIMGMCLL